MKESAGMPEGRGCAEPLVNGGICKSFVSYVGSDACQTRALSAGAQPPLYPVQARTAGPEDLLPSCAGGQWNGDAKAGHAE